MASFPCPKCGEPISAMDQVRNGVTSCGVCWSFVEIPAALDDDMTSPARVAAALDADPPQKISQGQMQDDDFTELVLGLALIGGIALIPLVILWAIGGWLLILKSLLWLLIAGCGISCLVLMGRVWTSDSSDDSDRDNSTNFTGHRDENLAGAVILGSIAALLLFAGAIFFRGLFLFTAIMSALGTVALFVGQVKRTDLLPSVAIRLGPPAATALILMSVWYFGGSLKSEGPGPTPPAHPVVPPRREKVLVIIVPGTWGNSNQWCTTAPGKVTFASELSLSLGGNNTIYPFLWAAPLSHRARLEAARNLVDVIDDHAANFDRVCLVGHSHGGNVALLAAANCRSPIDTVICLSTPHIYLETKNASGKPLPVPVYCPPNAFKRVRHIVCISPDTDSIVEGWADVWKGLTENDAIGTARPWLEELDHPRLADDGPDFLIFRSEGKNLAVSRTFPSFENTSNLTYHSQVGNGFDAHQAVHSRRIGVLVGQLLKAGPTEGNLEYVRTLLQPNGSDFGEPAESGVATFIKGIYEHDGGYKHCAWRLVRADIECVGNANAIANDADGSAPDLFLKAMVGNDIRRTSTVINRSRATWAPTNIVIPRNKELELAVYDSEPFGESRLHTFTLYPTTSPLSRIDAVPDKGWYWNLKMEWQSLHY